MTGFRPTVIDSIYEASVLPELWEGLLDKLSRLTGTEGGTLFAVDGDAVRYTASEWIAPMMSVFVRDGWMQRNIRTRRFMELNHAGFISDLDLVTHEEWEADPFYRDFLRPLGGGWCTGTVVRAPSGQIIVFNLERGAPRGPVPSSTVQALDELRPHLARSALISTLLGLERARSVAETLGKFGLAAAMITQKGKVVAANTLFERLSPQIRAGPFGQLRFAAPKTHRIFEETLERLRLSAHAGVRSIPIPAAGDSPAQVGHVVPVCRSARDIFSSVDAILLITPVLRERLPSADLLQGLFDLTPAEAALARRLLNGATLAEIAGAKSLSVETIRAQLRSVFAKTGTTRQAALVALLSGLRPLVE